MVCIIPLLSLIWACQIRIAELPPPCTEVGCSVGFVCVTRNGISGCVDPNHLDGGLAETVLNQDTGTRGRDANDASELNLQPDFWSADVGLTGADAFFESLPTSTDDSGLEDTLADCEPPPAETLTYATFCKPLIDCLNQCNGGSECNDCCTQKFPVRTQAYVAMISCWTEAGCFEDDSNVPSTECVDESNCQAETVRCLTAE